MRTLTTTTALAAALTLVPTMAVAAVDAPSGHTCMGQPATIVGTGAGEVLRGTQGDDVIQAYGGNDKVFGLGGNDVICGGGGKDKVRGGKGDDTVGGGKGNDLVWGGPGDDRLLGGKGDDRLFGRLHDDVIKGQAGRDKCRQDTRLEGGTGRVVGCEVPMTTSTKWVPYNQMTAAAGFRVKGDNSGGEVYLGNHLMGNGGANRVEDNYNALKGGGTFAVSVSFNAAENRLDGSVGAVSLSYDFDDKAAPGCAVGEWDLVQVSLWERVDDVELSFENGSVNGEALKKDLGGVSGMKTWTIEGVDFSTGWTVTGDLVASGAEWTGNERTKLEVTVGCKLDPQVAS